MSSVIIIRPISHSWDKETYMRYVTIPHGLLHLAAPLVAAGYDVKIIDEAVEENAEGLLKEELKKNPVCVGISSMTGAQISNGLRFSKIVKEESDIPVVWGGAHPTVEPEATLAHPLIDLVLCGDGEETFLELVGNLKNKKSVKGIQGVGYKEEGKIYVNGKRYVENLDSIPPLPFHLIQMEKYITSVKKKWISRYFEIHTGRGCPYNCAFCQNSVHRINRRMKSVAKIIEELKFLVEKYGIDGITWEDEIFSLDKNRIAQICQAILDKGIKVKLRGGFRVDNFSNYPDHFIELMKKAGFIHFGFGVETGSPRILKYINKNVTIGQIEKTIDRIKKYGFLATYNFMAGFPTETKEEFKETLKMILKIFKLNEQMIYPVSGPSFYTPFPGTRLHQEALKLGFNPPRSLEEWSKFDYNNVEMGWVDKDLMKFMREAREIVNNLNQKFTGEEAKLTPADYKPLEDLINT